jgi:hypothetical protein
MPSRPDLREIASNVRDAFAEMDREALLEILTFVVKEYVVEGPPPMVVHQAETLADLRATTFAQLVTALQTRFDFPELSMFVVDGDQVGVRVGGVVHPLVPGRQPMQAAELPRPQAGVRVVETTLQQRPAPQPQARPQPGAAPPPARGLAIRGRPTGEAAEQPPQPPPPAPAGAPQPGAPQAQPDKPESPSGDDASARFSLLELD